MEFHFLNQIFDDENEFVNPLINFDFNLLKDPEFKEDAVREEIIFPILGALGYSASSKNKVIRSRALKHPFYYFGTKKYNVNIIPDYTFEIEEKAKWILDAKRPTENIEVGKNVFQAYSYAMHPEIRSDIYGLCNGKKIVIFSVNEFKPILNIKIENLKNAWNELNKVLKPEMVMKPFLRNFKPDFGLFLYSIGEYKSKSSPFTISLKHLNFLTKIEENLYTISTSAEIKSNLNRKFACSFDFNEKIYKKLINLLPPALRDKINSNLIRQPFFYHNDDGDKVDLSLKIRLKNTIITNDNESYLPFEILDVNKESF